MAKRGFARLISVGRKFRRHGRDRALGLMSARLVPGDNRAIVRRYGGLISIARGPDRTDANPEFGAEEKHAKLGRGAGVNAAQTHSATNPVNARWGEGFCAPGQYSDRRTVPPKAKRVCWSAASNACEHSNRPQVHLTLSRPVVSPNAFTVPFVDSALFERRAKRRSLAPRSDRCPGDGDAPGAIDPSDWHWATPPPKNHRATGAQ